MAGNTNFPSALDDNSTLFDVVDNVTAIVASHHNNLKEAIKAVESKIGVYGGVVPTALDTRLGHPTLSHSHNGASGQGQPLAATALPLPSGAVPSGAITVSDHFTAGAIHGGQDGMGNRHIVPWFYPGSIPSGASLGAPFSFGRTLQLESLQAAVRRAPSGATLALDVNFGPTSIYTASQGLRPIMAPATIGWLGASPNLVTYPSGALVVIDVDKVGTNEPGTDLSLVFVFRE